MPSPAAIRAEADRLFAALCDTGAEPVETDILQLAGALLDLYGEDIRARAYVTQDPIRGEMMLRPDFTVPVVQMHMESGADPARYCYCGQVFRQQDHLSPRASEYLQVGYEVFARDTPAEADAEVFALFARLLAPCGLRPATGDIGLLLAAIRALQTTDRRKAALARHVWRPRRFRALLDRFAGRTPVPPTRLRLLDRLAASDAATLIARVGPALGLRSEAEIAARAAALLADAETPPLTATEAATLDDLMALSAPAAEALGHLRDIAVDMPALTPAVDRFADRLAALDARGIDAGSLPFEASHGRSTLEYYDGFVFAFQADRPGWPPVASGGRYDALTAVLGQGRAIPAVGGILRPALLAALKGAA
jgi:ATP phosphoribosyltransferase regulatory subunit